MECDSLLTLSEAGDQPGFWQALPRPIVGLAPMDGITDHPFRHIQKKYGNPDLVYTEFTSVEALCHGDWQSQRNFLFDESQRPIVAQLYGRTPEYFRQVAIMLCELGFDGIDLNMGCPAKTVADGGCGAGLIRIPDRAQAIIQAVKDGVRDWCNGATTANCSRLRAPFGDHVVTLHARLPAAYRQRRAIPVSVKTRIGYDAPAADVWVPRLLEAEPAAICLHGRTLVQGYGGRADWDAIGRAAELAKESSTAILGNGDVTARADAEQRAVAYGLDGVLIGRASFGDPFVFRPDHQPVGAEEDRQARLALRHRLIGIALEHARLFERTFQAYERYRFIAMRKHLGWYIKDIAGASYIRASLMQANSSEEVEALLRRQRRGVNPAYSWDGEPPAPGALSHFSTPAGS